VPAVANPPLPHDLDDVDAALGALAHGGPKLFLSGGFAAHVGAVTADAGDMRISGHDIRIRAAFPGG